MRNLFILLMIAMVSASSYAQNCCPYINELSALPSAPTDTDTLKVVVDIFTSTHGAMVYLNHSVSGNQININGCYSMGNGQATKHYLDTLIIGTLPAGVYLVNLKAYLSSESSNCVAADSNQRQISFTVSSSVGLEEADLPKWHVMPNPTHSQFSVEGLRKAHPIKVFDTSGRLVFEDREYQGGKIDCAHWRPGVYLILIEDKTLRVLVSG